MGRCCGSEGSNPHVVALRRVSPALLLVLLVGLMHSPGVPGAVANQGSVSQHLTLTRHGCL